jgi:hypothetical protein
MHGTRSGQSETYFLNVDLDVFARSSLEPLAPAFGSSVLQLYVGPRGNRFAAHFELRRHRTGADATIAGLVRLVKDLPRTARAAWNQAYRRDFNIGIQGGLKPYSYELSLKPETLKLVSSVNGRLVVTVYAADGPARSSPREAAAV